ncbi:hypothetical protein R3P38DRAFT_2777557 [Favolaschia claudopus]|uniref:Uncharacterized protein n=1 Tax=Favolaschia claudopus TaxID=2862362 RepID=A0AAW0BKI6_9AGAR
MSNYLKRMLTTIFRTTPLAGRRSIYSRLRRRCAAPRDADNDKRLDEGLCAPLLYASGAGLACRQPKPCEKRAERRFAAPRDDDDDKILEGVALYTLLEVWGAGLACRRLNPGAKMGEMSRNRREESFEGEVERGWWWYGDKSLVWLYKIKLNVNHWKLEWTCEADTSKRKCDESAPTLAFSSEKLKLFKLEHEQAAWIHEIRKI